MATVSAGQKQLAVRVEDSLLEAIDQKRMEVAAKGEGIPSRSDIVRDALMAYLSPPKKNQKGGS